MRKRKGGQPTSQPSNPADEGTRNLSAQPGETPPETSKIESPALVPSQPERADGGAAAGMPTDATKPAPRGAEPRKVAAPALASRSFMAARSLPLAAGIALAAAFGATAGSLATAGLAVLTTGEAGTRTASIEDVRALKESIVRMNTEMVALKASIDTSGRTANTQFAKFGERLDRFERAQAEPAARLAKITEAIERLEHRAPPATTTATTEATAALASLTPPAAAEPARPASPPIVEGWSLRGVSNGAALIQGRVGVIAVEPGDHLPGLGRIENIRRQDGRWVVVTSKGLIITR